MTVFKILSRIQLSHASLLRWPLLAAALLLGLLLVILDQRPLFIWPAPISPLKLQPPPSQGSVMILYSEDTYLTHSAYSPVGAWLNWAHQNHGPMHAWPVSHPLPTQPPPALLVLVTSDLPLSTQQLAWLEQYVQEGGTLLIDPVTSDLAPLAGWKPLPSPKLSRADSFSTAATTPSPVATMPFTLTHVTPHVPEEAQTLLAQLPLPKGPLQASALPDAQVLWRSGLQPLLVKRKVGAGHVFSTAFPLGKWLHQLQQGTPDEDGILRNRWPSQQSLPLETNDQVSHPSLLTAEWPAADLVEDALWQLVAEPAPLPSLWLYPDASAGAFLMTHDEESMGPRAHWMAQHDVQAGCPTTEFIVPSPAMDPEGMRTFERLGVEVGLHVVLPAPDGQLYPGSNFGLEGRLQPYGFWKFHPVVRLLSPAEQNDALQALFTQHPRATSSRTHFLAWPPEHQTFFQRLMAAGIEIDSSYGPDIQNRGFLFGTARPFLPLDPHGFPYGLYELPFVSAEDLGGADAAFMERILQHSQRETHQALSVLYHPNAFKWHPSVSNYATWKGLCARAQALDQRPMTMTSLARFWKQRAHSRVYHRVEGRFLELTLRLVGEGHSLVLPERWQGRVLQLPTRLATAGTRARFGQPLRLIPLPPGLHHLRVEYR